MFIKLTEMHKVCNRTDYYFKSVSKYYVRHILLHITEKIAKTTYEM